MQPERLTAQGIMQPERLTARFQEQGARGRERNRVSKSNPTAAVTIAYLSELYSLPRHLSIESDVRSEQLLAVVMYYLEKMVSDPEYDLTTDEIGPPFVRRGRVSSTRGLTDVGLGACGDPASPVLSKRHSGAAAHSHPTRRAARLHQAKSSSSEKLPLL